MSAGSTFTRSVSAARAFPAPGFTLIELLVVVAVIGVLAGLLVPAVQSSREAARRGQCVANLRQIGIALNSYESVHRVFPYSPLACAGGWAVTSLSELTYLLPHLEQAALYHAVNSSFGGSDSGLTPSLENRTARNTRLAVLLCPSDGEPVHLNSYRFNQGRFGMRPGMNFDGPFTMTAFPSPARITDGLSRTAFVSERLGGTFSATPGAPRDVKGWVGYPGVIRSDALFIPLCVTGEPFVWMNTSGRYWMYTGFADTHYNHNGAPNDPRPSCGQSLIRDIGCGLQPPRSFHPGIVNLLLGDGHVEAVSNSIEPHIWTALGTYNAGDF